MIIFAGKSEINTIMKISKLKSTSLFFAIVALFLACSEEKTIEKYENGNPKLVHILKKKDKTLQQVGEKRFYENGNKRHEGKIKGENRTGKWKFYFESGALFASADFTDSPLGSDWEVFDSTGTVLVSKDDKVKELHFAADGGLCDIKIVRGNNETFYKFFESFKVNIVSNMKGNIPNGETTAWFENGKLNSYYYYKDGIQDSIYKVYTEEGSLLVSGQYKQGKKIGKWEYFLSDGTPAGIEIYDIDGTLLKARQ